MNNILYTRTLCFFLAAGFALLSGCATLRPGHDAASAGAGITIERVHPSLAGQMLDFRYRVVDREKARASLNRQTRLYLVDQATGSRLEVPNMPKLGKLRQLPENIEGDRVYWMFFGNPGGLVKPGGMVMLVINDVRYEDIVVQ